MFTRFINWLLRGPVACTNCFAIIDSKTAIHRDGWFCNEGCYSEWWEAIQW